MTRFIDGPAGGVTLELRLAPVYLRVTHSGESGRDPRTGDALGRFDALDQIDDTAAPGEDIYCYRLKGGVGRGFIDGRDPKTGKHFGRAFVSAQYEYVGIPPGDEILRDNAKWAVWAECEEKT